MYKETRCRLAVLSKTVPNKFILSSKLLVIENDCLLMTVLQPKNLERNSVTSDIYIITFADADQFFH